MAGGIQTVIDYYAAGFFFFFKDPQVLEQELLLRLIGHIYFAREKQKFVDRKFHICRDITC